MFLSAPVGLTFRGWCGDTYECQGNDDRRHWPRWILAPRQLAITLPTRWRATERVSVASLAMPCELRRVDRKVVSALLSRCNDRMTGQHLLTPPQSIAVCLFSHNNLAAATFGDVKSDMQRVLDAVRAQPPDQVSRRGSHLWVVTHEMVVAPHQIAAYCAV